MSDPTLTLPGTIPGLLRRGSPVVSIGPWDIGGRYRREGLSSVVVGADMERPRLHRYGNQDRASIGLDLTDPTGGTHALWWLDGHSWPEILDACAALEIETWQIGSAMEAVRHHPDGAGIDGGIGHHLDLLRRVILQIAGGGR